MTTATILKDAFDLAVSHWILLLSTLLLARAVYRRYIHPLRTVPGPFLASITSLWLVKLAQSKTQHLELVDLHRKYGQVVRISPNRVLITSPKHLNEYFSWNKSQWWSAFNGHPTVIDHGTILDAEQARKAKAQIMGGYTMSQVMKSEFKIDTHIQALMSQFSKRANTTFDIAPWTQFFTLDVILDIAFSQPIGFIAHGIDVDNIISSIHSMFDLASVMGLFPSLPKLLSHPLWYPRFSPKASDTSGIAGLYGLAYRTVRTRLAESPDTQSQRADILQTLISHRDRSTGEAIPPALLEQEAKAPIFAGSDTTACNIRSLILHVYSNPRVYAKLMSQITTAEQHGLLSSPVARYEEIVQHVPYLAAVRRESLRICPIAGAPFYREVPKGGRTVEGYWLPGGTEVGIAHWPIARERVYWGEDVEVFRPERWEDWEGGEVGAKGKEGGEEEAERKRLRELGDVFFSKGGRLCTGRNVAALEVNKVFVEMLRRFEVQIVRPQQPWTEKGSLAVLHWGFDVVLTERKREREG